MTNSNPQDIDLDDLRLPAGVQFNMWTRAELVVGDARISLEGRHAGLMRELLRNRGESVPVSLLWTAMLIDGDPSPGQSIEDLVSNEIRQLRYTMSVRGILMDVDDIKGYKTVERAFSLKNISQTATPTRPMVMKSRKPKPRNTMTAPHSNDQTANGSRKTNCAPHDDVSRSLVGRLDKRDVSENRK